MDFQPMSPEEMQRMMQCLLQQQAQYAADFAQSQERFDAENKALSAKTDRIAGGLIGLTGILGQLAASQQQTDEQLRETDGHLNEVESHLNLVIEMFEQPARRSCGQARPAKVGHLRDDHGQQPS